MSTSRTAEYMALFRALESRRDPAGRWFTDEHARHFLRGTRRVAATLGRTQWSATLVCRLIDTIWQGPRSSGTVRTRVIDDAVDAAIAEGAAQLVLVGAGFDTRPVRLVDPTAVACFEVDLAATQQAKRAVLERVEADLCRHIRFVSADLSREPLDGTLLGAGLDRDRRCVVVWEGVTNYLDAPAVDRTLRSISRAVGAGSTVIFTYIDVRALRTPSPFPDAAAWASRVDRAGEPFTFGMDPACVPSRLATFGMTTERDVSTARAAAEYRGLRRESGSELYRVVIATTEQTRGALDAEDLRRAP